MKTPTVSVLISNYNYAEFLAEAIESALTQTYHPLEVIVVDDGSTDNSRDVIDRFRDRITPVYQARGGQAAAFNSGFAASRGEIVCILDADDRFAPHKIERIAAIICDRPSVDWVFHRVRPIDANGGALAQRRRNKASRKLDFRRAMRKRYSLRFSTPGGLCFTRSLLKQILPMPEARGVLLSDRYLKYAAMALGAGYYCDEPLGDQRFHDRNSYVGSADQRRTKSVIRIMTASALRRRLPEARRFVNYSFAEGLSLYRGQQEGRAEVDKIIADYLGEVSRIEKLEIAGLVRLHRVRQWLKQRRHRSASAEPDLERKEPGHTS